jgi:hypothetical protein
MIFFIAAEFLAIRIFLWRRYRVFNSIFNLLWFLHLLLALQVQFRDCSVVVGSSVVHISTDIVGLIRDLYTIIVNTK